ncbi:MAG: hypothetical protein EXR29_10940 [Betaproteobacteria bacterium]|nr:hypothetical protein [Betaproteobacteria bacterium]
MGRGEDGYQVTVTVLNRAAGTDLGIIENSLREACISLTPRWPSGEFGKAMHATAACGHPAR